MRSLTTIFVFLGVLVCHAAYADTWALPTTKTYSSEGDLFRLTVTPGIPGARKSKGKLEKQIKKGQYDVVWEADLSNDVSPVGALVTRDGQYVVTFDNWHSRGCGDNVVVLYGPKGQQIKRLSLSDFVDVTLESSLPQSVSSRWWGQGHQLDEKAEVVVLKVGNERPGLDGKPVNEYEVRIRLKDGKLEGNKAGAQVPSANRTVEKAYLHYCLACHDANGKGNPMIRSAMPEIPDFTSAQWQKSRTDSDLAQSILSGKGKFHPPMAEKLKDVDVKQLVSQVRAFQVGQIIPAPIPRVVVPITPLNPVRAGAAIFRTFCLVCHGPDGKGAHMRPVLPPIPDFTNPRFHEERSDAQMMVSILEGKGTLMPAHGGRFTEEQARCLVDFIRTIRTEVLPAQQQKLTPVPPVTSSTVKVIRVSMPDRTLVVEIYDGQVNVTIGSDGGLIITGAGPEDVRLSSSSYRSPAAGDEKPVKDELVRISRGGKPVVKVGTEPTGQSENTRHRGTQEEQKWAAIGLFNRYCIRCHGVDGRGVWDIPKVPQFTDGHWQSSRSDSEIVRTILEGRGGAPGRMRESRNLPPPSRQTGVHSWVVMPSFEDTLTLEEAWGMAGFVRGFVPSAALRYYKDKLATDLKLANHLYFPSHYNVACSAALVGCDQSQGTVADGLNDVERARLRQQALDWLRNDLTMWSQHLAKQPDQVRSRAQQALRIWQQDAAFEGVRGDALAKLPEAERQLWQRLWADVELTLNKASQNETEAQKIQRTK